LLLLLLLLLDELDLEEAGESKGRDRGAEESLTEEG
jgi:hypothetical protein